MPCIPPVIRPVRCRGTLLTPLPLSHSSPVPHLHSVLVIQPSSAMTRRYGVGMGLVVEPHALLRLIVPGLHMPLVTTVLLSAILLRVGVHLTWFCCGQCSLSTLVGATSPPRLMLPYPPPTLPIPSVPLCPPSMILHLCPSLVSHSSFGNDVT
jgi:hypothetical protein